MSWTFSTWVGPEFDMRWEPLKIDAGGLADDTKGSLPIDTVELGKTGPEFDERGAVIDKLNPLKSDPWAETSTEVGGRDEVILVDTGCTGTCVADVDGFIPRTELRLGDDGGKELDCEGGTAVDIVGGEVMDNDAIDDTKSATLDATLSDSET